jgi:chemotaxis-related protein WspB
MLALILQIGNDCLALDVKRVKEVVPRVRLERPGVGLDMLAGVFVYRGQVVPVIDLHRLAGAGECPSNLASRIVIVPYPDDGTGGLLGLLAGQVAEIREMQAPASTGMVQRVGAGAGDWGMVAVDREKIVRFLDIDRLLPAEARQQLRLEKS